jgi:hypothetical protein
MVLGAIMSDAFPGILTTAGVSIMFFGILISRLKGGISIVDNGAH